MSTCIYIYIIYIYIYRERDICMYVHIYLYKYKYLCHKDLKQFDINSKKKRGLLKSVLFFGINLNYYLLIKSVDFYLLNFT